MTEVLSTGTLDRNSINQLSILAPTLIVYSLVCVINIFAIRWIDSFIDKHHGINITLTMVQKYNEASVYDQKIPESHTADQPTVPCGRATEQSMS